MVTLTIAALFIWLVIGTAGLGHRATHPPGGSMGRALARGLPTDPGEARLQWSEDTCRSSDNLSLPIWRIKGDAPEGPVLIRLHDWGQSPIDALAHIDTDRIEAHTVLLPTLRGHDGAAGRCTLGHRETDDLKALLATIEGDVILAGTGLGGLIAVACGRVSSVVDVRLDAPWLDRHEGLRRILAQLGQPAFPFAWTARILLP